MCIFLMLTPGHNTISNWNYPANDKKQPNLDIRFDVDPAVGIIQVGVRLWECKCAGTFDVILS